MAIARVRTGPFASRDAAGSAYALVEACARLFSAAASENETDHEIETRGRSAALKDASDVHASRAGDPEAYRRLIDRHQADVAGRMRRFSRDPAVIDELVHDVFVEAFLGLKNYRGDAPFVHWLRKLAVRAGYRHWWRNARRKQVRPLSDTDWERLRGEAPPPETATEAAELVHSLLERLPGPDRLIITLLHLEELSIAEAADRAGWTVINTKVRAFRARAKLKKLIEKGT